MAASVNARLLEVGRVFSQFGFGLALDRMGLSALLGQRRGKETAAQRAAQGPVQFRRALERLGPFWVKIGQMLATRPDMMPEAFLRELEHLQDKVVVQPFAEMEAVIRANVPNGDLAALFKHINPEPLGTASLAQVYAATLRDGQEVVLKVQRPRAKAQIDLDTRVFERIAGLLERRAPDFAELIDMGALMSNIFTAMKAETDFTQEASNMDDFRKLLEGDSDMDRITIPKPYWDSTTPQILTMERVRGRSVRFLKPSADAAEERDRLELAGQLVRFVGKQLLMEGRFHADPHPGNVFMTDDKRLAMIDWGMIGQVDVGMMEYILRIMLNLNLNDGRGVAVTWMEMGAPSKQANKDRFISDCMRFVPTIASADLEKLNFGVALSQIMGFAYKNKIITTPAVSTIGKALANVDGTGRCLTGRISPVDTLIDYFPKIALHHAKHRVSRENAGRLVGDVATAAQRVPEQLRLLLDQAYSDKFKLLIEPAGYDRFLKRFEKSIKSSYRFLGFAIIVAAIILARAIRSLGP